MSEQTEYYWERMRRERDDAVKELSSLRTRLASAEEELAKERKSADVWARSEHQRAKERDSAERKLASAELLIEDNTRAFDALRHQFLSAELRVERMRKALEDIRSHAGRQPSVDATAVEICGIIRNAVAPSDDSKEAGLLLKLWEAAKRCRHTYGCLCVLCETLNDLAARKP